jgi:hypothetical protein
MANIHPDFNKYGKWAESEVAKKVSELKFDTRANGDKFDFDAAKQAADGKGTTSSTSSKKEGPPERKKHKTSKCTNVCMCIYNTDYIDTDRMYLLGRYRNMHKSFNHTVLSTIYANNTVSNIHVLLDTGALQSDYVSTKIAGWLEANQVQKVDSKVARVCTAFDECKLINYSFNTKFSFIFINKKNRVDSNTRDTESSTNSSRLSLPFMEEEESNLENRRKRKVQNLENKSTVDSHTYEFELKQIDIPFDVIIGRKSIIKYHLLRYDKDFQSCVVDRKSHDSVLTTSPDDTRETEEVLDAPDTLSSEHSDTKQIVDPTDE